MDKLQEQLKAEQEAKRQKELDERNKQPPVIIENKPTEPETPGALRRAGGT